MAGDFHEIDLDRLDFEWVQQVRLYHKYADDTAKFRRLYSEAKAAMEVTKAEMSLEIRNSPSEFGLDRITEATVESKVLTLQVFKEAQQKVFDAKYDLDIAEAAVWTLEHRKKALEDLVNLHGRDYRSVPRAPPEDRDRLDMARRRDMYDRARQEREARPRGSSP